MNIDDLAIRCVECSGVNRAVAVRAPQLSTQNQEMDIDAAFEEILRADPSLMEKILKIQPCVIEKLKAFVANGGQLSRDSLTEIFRVCENSCYTVQNPCGGTSLPSPAPTPVY